MYVTFHRIDELSTELVSFYTVTLGDNELTEFEYFDGKDFPDHIQEIEITYRVIQEIGIRTARKIFFKPEERAHAIPIVTDEIKDANDDDFGLRLYCIRLRDDLVVLLNGDIKTTRKAQDCRNVKRHFVIANKIARALDDALANREINYREKDCLTDFEIEI